MERDEYIRVYFDLGFTQKEILVCLIQIHDILISERHLRRLLKQQGLSRQNRQTDIWTVALFIEEQLKSCGQLYGFRWMHRKCLQHGLVVTQISVRVLLNILDPEGVAARRRNRLVRRIYRSNGPNDTWHIDGYDKLKPFGVAISGCIDGFSRSIIWLEAYYTNNNPKVILGYFVRAIREKNGCPRKIRADMGTENVYVKRAQTFLRRHGTDAFTGERSFIVGTSVTNQRIESWWGFLRKNCIQYYMDILHILKEDGEYTGDRLDTELVRFCFMKIIQDDLDQVQHAWNTHKMRPDKKSNRPSGRPVLLYSIPELYKVEERLITVDRDDVSECETECVYKNKYPCIRDIFEVSCILMEENNWVPPSNGYEAARLYQKLRNQIRNDLYLML